MNLFDLIEAHKMCSDGEDEYFDLKHQGLSPQEIYERISPQHIDWMLSVVFDYLYASEDLLDAAMLYFDAHGDARYITMNSKQAGESIRQRFPILADLLKQISSDRLDELGLE